MRCANARRSAFNRSDVGQDKTVRGTLESRAKPLTAAIRSGLLTVSASIRRAPAAIAGLGPVVEDPAALVGIACLHPFEPSAVGQAHELDQHAAEPADWAPRHRAQVERAVPRRGDRQRETSRRSARAHVPRSSAASARRPGTAGARRAAPRPRDARLVKSGRLVSGGRGPEAIVPAARESRARRRVHARRPVPHTAAGRSSSRNRRAAPHRRGPGTCWTVS